MLWLAKRVIFGITINSKIKEMKDINIREGFVLITLAFITIFFGFYPDPIINTLTVSVEDLINNYNNEIANKF